MPRVNKTQYAVLGCLSLKSMTAYDIKQFMERTTAHFWTEGEGQLYPTLAALAKRKLVEYQEEEAAKKGTKKVYSITKAGLDILRAWLAKPAESQIYRNELLLKLFFGSQQGDEVNGRLLQDKQLELEQTLEELKTIKNEQRSHLPAKRKKYIDATLDYGISVIGAELAWYKRTLKILSQ